MTSLRTRPQPSSGYSAGRPVKNRSLPSLNRDKAAPPALASQGASKAAYGVPATMRESSRRQTHREPVYRHLTPTASSSSISDASVDESHDSFDGGGADPFGRDAQPYNPQLRDPVESWLESSYGSPRTPVARARSRPIATRDTYGWDEHADLPPYLRISASSTATQIDTPPRTPVDGASFGGYRLPAVVVAAPVADVGTMDALVDGMNGFGSDDMFMGERSMPLHRERTRRGGGKSAKNPLFNPLNQPPLPTPPPGIVLGGGRGRRPSFHSEDSADDESVAEERSTQRRRRIRRPENSRTPSTATITAEPPAYLPPPSPALSTGSRSLRDRPSISEIVQKNTAPQASRAVVPSISDIIRKHAPAPAPARVRPPSRASSAYSRGHASVREETEDDAEFVTADEADLVSRTSIDSIAAEVQRTLRTQTTHTHKPSPLHHAHSFPRRPLSAVSDGRFSVTSDGVRNASASVYSSSAASRYQPSSPFDVSVIDPAPEDPSQIIVTYLRSARLTTLLQLTRGPHASREFPLNVSLCDLGAQDGFPLVVFLGLGCVRHVLGLYDEMAELLGLRIIAIDRWGLGRTGTGHSKYARGVAEWASVVEEVLDRLQIHKCSVMAHSAGAPYALSFASRAPHRIHGEICLLAPWVGGNEAAGYKWLKYIPNGILKTAQAAEWKIQTWMIGKPPKVAFQGIGYNVHAPLSSETFANRPMTPESGIFVSPRQSTVGTRSRPSDGSGSGSGGTFSDYDDLRDFEGRFGSSGSTLGGHTQRSRTASGKELPSDARKPSRSLFGRLKGGASQSRAVSLDATLVGDAPSGKKLKGLRSIGSLKKQSSSAPHTASRASSVSAVAPSLNSNVSLDLGAIDWTLAHDITTSPISSGAPRSRLTTTESTSSLQGPVPYRQSSGQRSLSLTGAARPPAESAPPSPKLSMPGSPDGSYSPGTSYQAALANALIAASHAEAARGVHGDLLQILNHDGKPWGFSYAAYPHAVQVWYGDRDEKIAENAVRWMERTMGAAGCQVRVVKGADHALMYNSSVVVEVLEHVRDSWGKGR